MKHTRKPRIGIIGMGHFIYWPQFEGLKETLMQKQQSFKAYFSGESDLIDLGFADDIDTSFEALKRAESADLDALFIINVHLHHLRRCVPVCQISARAADFGGHPAARPARLRQNHHLYAAVQRRYLLTSRIFRRV